MNTKFNFKKLSVSFAFSSLLLVSTNLIAQEEHENDLKNFKVVLEKTDEGVRLKGIEGVAWIDLSFNLSDKQSQAVDESGMTNFNENSPLADPNLANFLFTVTKTESGIVLKGIEGTAWTELSFSLEKNSKQAINQFGMTDLE